MFKFAVSYSVHEFYNYLYNWISHEQCETDCTDLVITRYDGSKSLLPIKGEG